MILGPRQSKQPQTEGGSQRHACLPRLLSYTEGKVRSVLKTYGGVEVYPNLVGSEVLTAVLSGPVVFPASSQSEKQQERRRRRRRQKQQPNKVPRKVSGPLKNGACGEGKGGQAGACQHIALCRLPIPSPSLQLYTNEAEQS